MQLLKHFCALGRAPGISASGATLGFTRHVSTSPVNDKRSDQETLYDILGVTRAASIVNIKAAFRKRAKELHPDVQEPDISEVNHSAFLRVLTAYKVLSDDRERQLYDLSLDSRASRIAKEATRGSEEIRDEGEGDWVQGGGWRAWVARTARSQDIANPSNDLDRLRAELRNDFRSALRHAYLGPRLDLGRGELPEAFEAEERSVPGLGDLLHLVSGRTLIGIVRERSTDCLDDSASSMHAYLRSEHEERRKSIPSPTPPLPGQHSSSSSSGSGGSGSSQDEPVERAACESMSSHASSNGCNVEEDGEGQSVGETRHPASRCYDAGTDFRWQHHEGTDLGAGQAPQILDLIVQEELVAVAVRQRGSLAGSTSSSEPRQQAGDVHMRDAQQHAPGRKQGAESRPGSITGRSSSDCIAGGTINMYTAEGQLLCTLADGQLRGGCLDDRVKFSVIRSATPLVRHLHFVAETGGKRTVVCRCKRAWMPPASTWLFPPRSPLHATGGYYFEWPGHNPKQVQNPMWLHPAIFILAAAFDSLAHEVSRRGNTAGAAQHQERIQWDDVEPEAQPGLQGAKSWARKFLKFHGWA